MHRLHEVAVLAGEEVIDEGPMGTSNPSYLEVLQALSDLLCSLLTDDPKHRDGSFVGIIHKIYKQLALIRQMP
jgi:hypothetical protein